MLLVCSMCKILRISSNVLVPGLLSPFLIKKFPLKFVLTFCEDNY